MERAGKKEQREPDLLRREDGNVKKKKKRIRKRKIREVCLRRSK